MYYSSIDFVLKSSKKPRKSLEVCGFYMLEYPK